MQQIYRQSDEQFEVFTTIFSPKVCRSRTRQVEAGEVVVAVTQYRSRWLKDLDLSQGDQIQVLFKRDKTWWFGRLTNGTEGYFPAACVEQLQGGDSARATPTLLRRGSVPVVVTAPCAPCGCTSGRSTPKLLRQHGATRGSSSDPPPSSPGLLHRILSKSRRKSCPHLSHPPADNGSVNTAFQPD